MRILTGRCGCRRGVSETGGVSSTSSRTAGVHANANPREHSRRQPHVRREIARENAPSKAPSRGHALTTHKVKDGGCNSTDGLCPSQHQCTETGNDALQEARVWHGVRCQYLAQQQQRGPDNAVHQLWVHVTVGRHLQQQVHDRVVDLLEVHAASTEPATVATQCADMHTHGSHARC